MPASTALAKTGSTCHFRTEWHTELVVPTHRTRVTGGGRVVIPAELRRQLGLQPGAEVMLDVTDGELRIRSMQRAIELAQALVHSVVPQGVSLADELIRDRREAAGRE